MEAYPLSARNNAELCCKDVIEVLEIVRSKIGNYNQPVEQARVFAKMFGPSGNTLNHLISKISCLNNKRVELSVFSQINTTNEPLITEQDSNGHLDGLDDDRTFKDSSVFCGKKVCLAHLLDLVIVLMAAAGNFGTAPDEASREPRVKCDQAEDTTSSFKAFSVRLWRKGVKSAGLLRDKTKTAAFEGNVKENSKVDTVATCNSIYENKKENEIQQRDGQQEASKTFTGKKVDGTTNDLTVKRSLRNLPSTLGNESNNQRANEVTEDNNTVHAAKQKKQQRRKLPQLKDTLVEKIAETRGCLTSSVKKLQIETDTLWNETQALKSQLEVLIKDNRDVRGSLVREKTEKENVMQKCKDLRRQLDEHENSSRERAFELNSRLERLQHAKLTADQGCLKLSLRQERFEVYEEQATLLCKRSIEIIRKELEERHGLFAIEQRKYGMEHSTLDGLPEAGNGLTMYQAHRELQNFIVELIKRYRTDLKLLTGTRDEEDAKEVICDCYEKESNAFLTTIEERRDSMSNYLTEDTAERYRTAFGIPLEPESCYAMNRHEILNDNESQTTFTLQKCQERKTPLKPRRRLGNGTGRGTDEHRDRYLRQKQRRNDLDMEETRSLKDFSSGSLSMVSEFKQYPKRSSSLNTIDKGRHHGQPSCSSIVALLRSSQRSCNMGSGAKANHVECSACRKNKEQRRRIKKSLSSCESRERMSDVYYV